MTKNARIRERQVRQQSKYRKVEFILIGQIKEECPKRTGVKSPLFVIGYATEELSRGFYFSLFPPPRSLSPGPNKMPHIAYNNSERSVPDVHASLVGTSGFPIRANLGSSYGSSYWSTKPTRPSERGVEGGTRPVLATVSVQDKGLSRGAEDPGVIGIPCPSPDFPPGSSTTAPCFFFCGPDALFIYALYRPLGSLKCTRRAIDTAHH
jgi:hypothetical protein